jgi:hypothetical protein
MSLLTIGRLLLGVGLLLVGAGLVFLLAHRFGIQIGRLPGDFVFRRGNTTIMFPLATSLLVSLILTLLLNLVLRWWNR